MEHSILESLLAMLLLKKKVVEIGKSIAVYNSKLLTLVFSSINPVNILTPQFL
jgi:hypothetical protein